MQLQATYAVQDEQTDDTAILDILRIAIARIQECERETVIEGVPLVARQARRDAHRAINGLASASDYWHATRTRPGATNGEIHAAMHGVRTATERAARAVTEWYKAETPARRRIVRPFMDILAGGDYDG
jgi:hypothetical protein